MFLRIPKHERNTSKVELKHMVELGRARPDPQNSDRPKFSVKGPENGCFQPIPPSYSTLPREQESAHRKAHDQVWHEFILSTDT